MVVAKVDGKRAIGFALPTVLIASTVMLLVLASGLASITTIVSSLSDRHYNTLAREAAESGVATALACLQASSFVVTWSTESPLTQNTDCNGTTRAECASGCWLLKDTYNRSGFSVAPPTINSSGLLTLSSKGQIEQLRTSSQLPWRSHFATSSIASSLVTTPQLGGGAGWKDSGHIGFFVSGEGKLYAWGDNRYQAIGPPSLGSIITTPVLVEPPAGETIVKSVASAGQGASLICAIFLSGNVYCRGNPGADNNSLMPTTPGWARFGLSSGLSAKSIVINGYGGDALCVIANNDQAYCAGDNPRGALGIGDENSRTIAAPARVMIPNGLSAKNAFTQDWRTCIITTNTAVHCSGANDFGQLGNNTTTSYVTPVTVSGISNIIDVKTTYHSLALTTYFLTATGELYGAGSNSYGTLNDSGPASNYYTTPRLLRSGVGAIISIGVRGDSYNTLCAIDTTPANGTSGVWCMGDNTYGQVGGPCGTKKPTWTQISLGGAQADATRTRSAGYQMNSVMVIATDGRVFAWGDNTYGKLATSHPTIACNPDARPMSLPAGVTVSSISNVDEYSSAVLTTTSDIYSAGRNDVGQLGNGTTNNSSIPVRVPIERSVIFF